MPRSERIWTGSEQHKDEGGGDETKNKKGENMRSWKKCKCDREEDPTKRDRNGSSRQVIEAGKKKAQIILKNEEMQQRGVMALYGIVWCVRKIAKKNDC